MSKSFLETYLGHVEALIKPYGKIYWVSNTTRFSVSDREGDMLAIDLHSPISYVERTEIVYLLGQILDFHAQRLVMEARINGCREHFIFEPGNFISGSKVVESLLDRLMQNYGIQGYRAYYNTTTATLDIHTPNGVSRMPVDSKPIVKEEENKSKNKKKLLLLK